MLLPGAARRPAARLAGRPHLRRSRGLLRPHRRHPRPRHHEPPAARMPARYHLATLLLAYLLLPLVLAAPLVALVPGLGLGGGYFEMLVLPHHHRRHALRPAAAPRRAAAPLAGAGRLDGRAHGARHRLRHPRAAQPRRLRDRPRRAPSRRRGQPQRHASRRRTGASCARSATITPIYAGLTAALALALYPRRRPGRSSPSATPWRRSRPAPSRRSAASPAPSPGGSASSPIALFLLPAVSHRGFSLEARRRGRPAALRPADPAHADHRARGDGGPLPAQLRRRRRDRPPGQPRSPRCGRSGAASSPLLSFLTTTGFVSEDWRATQLWSDLPEPGIILLGVAVMGGGIATTAGGSSSCASTRSTATACARWTSSSTRSSVGRRGQGDALISRGRRAHRLHLPDADADRARPGDARARRHRPQLPARASRLAVAGLTTTGPAIRTLGRRARLRRPLRRRAGGLLRRDDRRAAWRCW